MTARFVACSTCSRHVRAGECACPFCGAKSPCAKPLRSITDRLSRAALHAAGAAGAVVVITDCSSSPNVSAFYGAACVDDCGVVVADASVDVVADTTTTSFYGGSPVDYSVPPQDTGAGEAEASADSREDAEDSGVTGDASTDDEGD